MTQTGTMTNGTWDSNEGAGPVTPPEITITGRCLTKPQVRAAERRRVAWALRQQGLTIVQIAEKMGHGKHTVWAWLKTAERRVRYGRDV